MKKLETLMIVLIGLLIVNMGLTVYLIKRINPPEKLTLETSQKEMPLPELVKRVSPEYPEDLRKKGIEGKVVLKVLVDTTGKVKEVMIARSSGYTALDSSAVKAVKKFEFRPAVSNGKKISSWVTIPFVFKLAK